MPEYLKALHERFTRETSQAKIILRERDRLLVKLRGQLSKRQRILLLHLLDLEDDLRDQTSLDSFLSGIRLARGIEQELSEIPPTPSTVRTRNKPSRKQVKHHAEKTPDQRQCVQAHR